MDTPSLPKADSLEEVAHSNKKRGIPHTILLSLQAHLVELIGFVILILVFSFFQYKNEERFNSIANTIQNKIANSNQLIVSNSSKPQQVNTLEDVEPVLGDKVDFNPKDWIIDSGFYGPDKDGYYCNQTGFGYWSIWSKKTYPPETNIKVRFKLKQTDNKGIPFVVISYGEYIENYSPKTYYFLKIFDGDKPVIRLYDDNNKSHGQDYLKITPNLNYDMKLSITPVIPDRPGTSINLNYELDYQGVETQQLEPHKPTKGYLSVPVNLIDLSDGTVSKQIGIGVEKGNCIQLENAILN